MEVVREGRVIIHLEMGKVELKAPQLDGLLKARERELALLDRIRKEEEAIARIRTAQSSAAGGGGGFAPPSIGGGASGGGSAASVSAIDQYQQAIEKVHQSQLKAARSAMQVGEGVFRLGRAAILLGASSDESFTRMIQGLAQVQAYFDLFKGSIQIVVGLTTALQHLANAQKAINAAMAIGQSLNIASAYSSAAVAARALLGALGPVGATIAVIATVVAAAAGSWDLLTTSQAEAAAQAKETARIQKESAESVFAGVQRQIDREHELMDLRRLAMTEAQKIASLQSQAAGEAAGAGHLGSIAHTLGGGELAAQEAARNMALKSAQLQQQAIDAANQRLDAEMRVKDAMVDQIEKQERLVESARKQVQAEQEKVRQFQAQVGALSASEQARLRVIRDNLLAGKSVSRFDEELLDRAGPQGQGVAARIRSDRAAAAGFDENFFSGIAGAGTGLKDASSELAKVVAALEKLTGGVSAEEAKLKLEKEKQALETQYKEFYAGAIKAIEKLIPLIEILDSRIAQLEQAARRGR